MLDVLHIPNATTVRSARAWYGSSCLLAGRIVDEIDFGKSLRWNGIPPLGVAYEVLRVVRNKNSAG
jgi:hypothetical protein